MFDNIDRKILKTPSQKKEGDKIIKAKAGRKPKPNMKKYIFSMDIALHKKLTEHAKSSGLEKSSIVNRLVMSYLNQVDRENYQKDVAKKLLLEGIHEKIVSKVTEIPLSQLKMY